MLSELRYFCCTSSIRSFNLRHFRDFRAQAKTKFGRRGKIAGGELQPKSSAETLSGKLKLLIGPTVFTISCCGLVHVYAEPFCRYFFPRTSSHEQFLQDLFNPILTRRQMENKDSPVSIWWKTKSSLEKLIWGIVFMNGFVFFSIRVFPAFSPSMLRLFIAGPRYSLLGIPLAMFTHLGGLHFTLNSYALTTFGPAFRSALSESEFLKLYMQSGIVANYLVVVSKILSGSHAYAMVGASAAIYGLIGFISQAYPEKQIGIILLSDLFPQISFKLRDAPILLLCVDGFALMSGWLSKNVKRANFIAHEAHIAGLVFGLMYYYWMSSDVVR